MILIVKIANRYFKREECFSARQFRSFDGGSVRIEGAKTLHCQLFIQSILPATQDSIYLA